MVLIILEGVAVYLYFSDTVKAGDIIDANWIGGMTNDERVSVQNKWGCCGLAERGDKIGVPCPPDAQQSQTPCKPLLLDMWNSFEKEFFFFCFCLMFIQLVMLVLT